MTGRVVGFTQSPHQLAFEVLPWFVNGTLDAGERTLVEQHLQSCAACRREYDWLCKLSGAHAHSEPVVDVERAFARIAPQLAMDETRPTRDVSTPPRAWRRLLRRIQVPDARWLRFAAAMQLGVIVALGWALAVREPPAYRTLGAPAATQAAGHLGGSIIVVFDPATREDEVRRILNDAGARLVDGPTATNGYVLAVANTADARAAALRRLRAERAVTLAEPLVSEHAR